MESFRRLAALMRKTSQELKCQAAVLSVFVAYCGQAVVSS